MSVTRGLAVALGLVVVAGVVWWGFAGRRRAESSAVPVVAQVPTEFENAEVSSAEGRTQETGDAREAAPLATPTERAPSAAAGLVVARTATLDARFVDAGGVPWRGVRLEAFDPSRPTARWGPPGLSGADGRVHMELVFPAPIGPAELPMSTQRLEFVAGRSGCTTVGRSALVSVGETVHLGDIVLGVGMRLSGRVLDEQGRGVPRATVGSAGAELPPEEDGKLRRHGAAAFGVPRTESADDGTFVLDGVEAGSWRLWGHAAGTRYAWSGPLTVSAERDLAGLELVLLPLASSDRIEGRIVDPAGAPFQAALSSLVHDARYGGFGRGERVDAQGRFALVVEHDGELWDLTARDFSGRFATTTVQGVRPGTLDLVIRLQAPRYLEVLVRDTEGHAMESAGFSVGVGGMWSDPRAEALAPGRYRVPIPDAQFRVEVSARGFRAETSRRLEPATLPASLDVVLQRAPFVRGHVVSAGRAVSGARVELHTDDPEALETIDGFRCVMSAMADIEGATGGDGRFELACDLDGAFWIRVTAADLAPTEIGPLDAADLAAADFEVVLNEGGTLEGRVLLAGGADAEGAIVAINHGDGAPRTMRAGPQGFFRFEHLAVGPWQVLASAAEMLPDAGVYSSLDAAEPIEWSCEVTAGRTTRYDLDLSSK